MHHAPENHIGVQPVTIVTQQHVLPRAAYKQIFPNSTHEHVVTGAAINMIVASAAAGPVAG